MTDILIRGVPEAAAAQIDRMAQSAGISRNEYLRRWLLQGVRPAQKVTVEDLQRASWLARDLEDPDVMAQAWGSRCERG